MLLLILGNAEQYSKDNPDCTYSSQSSLKPCNLNKGLVFLKERDIILSTDVWTIVVSVNTEDYDQVIYDVESIFEYLESEDKNVEIKDLVPHYEISQLRTSLQITKQEIDNLKLLLPTTRARRGVINGIGSVLKFLFGTMDDDDLQTLNSKINNLDDQSDVLVHVEDEKLTYMKKLTGEVDENSKAIKTIAGILKSTITEIKTTNFSIWTEITQLKRKLQYQARISSLFREVEMTLRLIDKQLVQLQEALDVTATGHLSSMLLTPSKLYDVLKEIIPKLPNGLSLLTDVELDKIYSYYRLAKVNAVSVKNIVRLIIELPLQSPDRHFELYSVRPLPYYDHALTQFIVVKSEASYFAISVDRQLHITFEDSQLKDCSDPPYEVCPIRLPLLPAAESDSCLHAMFIGDDTKAQQFCHRAVIPSYTSSTLYQGPSGDYWIYSVPKATRVTWRCFYTNNTMKPVRTVTEMINGTGVMFNTRNCYIYSKYFILLPHSNGQTYIKNKLTPIVVPAIKELISPSELSFLTPQANKSSNDDKTISELQQILNNETDRVNAISIDVLQRKLKDIRKTKAETNSGFLTYLTLTLVVILITSCVTVTCVLHYVYARRPCQSTRMPQQDVELELESEPTCAMPTAIHVYDLTRNDATPGTTRFAQGQLSTLA